MNGTATVPVAGSEEDDRERSEVIRLASVLSVWRVAWPGRHGVKARTPVHGLETVGLPVVQRRMMPAVESRRLQARIIRIDRSIYGFARLSLFRQKLNLSSRSGAGVRERQQ